jgi:hypothetical protein
MNNLGTQGYHKFDVRLGSEICDALAEFARVTPSKPRIAGYENKRVPS